MTATYYAVYFKDVFEILAPSRMHVADTRLAVQARYGCHPDAVTARPITGVHPRWLSDEWWAAQGRRHPALAD